MKLRRLGLLPAALLSMALFLPSTPSPALAHTANARSYRNAKATTEAYFGVLNAGMASGTFSKLSSVFSTNAVLTKSNPDGTTAVFRGISEIAGFYQTLYTKVAGWQWTTDQIRMLRPDVVIAYEHAGSPPLTVASRCVHVFVIKKGKIVSYDWTAFYPGQK